MIPAFETQSLTKQFDDTTALSAVTTAVPTGSIVGLVGRNGSGKTTLLHHLTGLYLPTQGASFTLGAPSARLSAAELARIGVVHQAGRLLEWMTVRQHLRYVSSFYARWDRRREDRLVADFELDGGQPVATLSPGNVQKLAVILAVGHHPDLLLLDEPASGLDPIAREQMWQLLLELTREDGTTIVVSSHVLRDVERVVDWIVCLERGHLCASAPLDDLQETFAEWIVTGSYRPLPGRYEEPYVLAQEATPLRARLTVRRGADDLASFKAKYGADVEARPLNLEAMFPLLIARKAS